MKMELKNAKSEREVKNVFNTINICCIHLIDSEKIADLSSTQIHKITLSSHSSRSESFPFLSSFFKIQNFAVTFLF